MLAKVARVHCSLLVGHFRYGLMGPYEGGLAADPMDQLIVLLREVKKSLIPITLSDLHQWKLVNLQHHTDWDAPSTLARSPFRIIRTGTSTHYYHMGDRDSPTPEYRLANSPAHPAIGDSTIAYIKGVAAP